MAERQQRLAHAAAQLKHELHGIDGVIDSVIDAVRAWYVLPQIITRPVIVCLWGLTGTGKTQLTRRLAQLLGFYDRFVEVQMDGFSHGSGYRSTSVSAMLAESSIDEGEPGMLVLDEFQRFRTVSRDGEDLKVERYQDVWALLSDGRLPPALGTLKDIEHRIASACYDEQRERDDATTTGDDNGDNDVHDSTKRGKNKAPARFHLDAWDAQSLKHMLKLKEPLLDIMAWPLARVQALLFEFQRAQEAWETDYSRLLIFVCGNLDEMYAQTARRVEDCDTDADVFHHLTSQLSLIDVKKALAGRFRPEQIARLGNHHVIYPSFSRATYERLIADAVARYVDGIARNVGLRFVVGNDVLAEIYRNAVFPAQGTRPLFSSVHAILSAGLVEAALWALGENAMDATDMTDAMGATGTTGTTNAAGATGAATAAGTTDVANAASATDAATAAGATGAANAAGTTGVANATGATGATNAAGATGAANAAGATGATNATGATGAASAAGMPMHATLTVTLAASGRRLAVSAPTRDGQTMRREFAVPLELSRIRQRSSADFRALLAVHEAGHGLVYSLLFGRVPQEIRINIASFEGGYNSFCALQVTTRRNSLDMICVGLAGRVAEEMVFGDMACTTGAEQDYKQATEEAARYLRHHGFGQRISRTDVADAADQHLNTDIAPSNHEMETLLRAQYERATRLLRAHAAALKTIAQTLVQDGLVEPDNMTKLLATHGIVAWPPRAESGQPHGTVLEPFAAHLARFVSEVEESGEGFSFLERMAGAGIKGVPNEKGVCGI